MKEQSTNQVSNVNNGTEHTNGTEWAITSTIVSPSRKCICDRHCLDMTTLKTCTCTQSHAPGYLPQTWPCRHVLANCAVLQGYTRTVDFDPSRYNVRMWLTYEEYKDREYRWAPYGGRPAVQSPTLPPWVLLPTP